MRRRRRIRLPWLHRVPDGQDPRPPTPEEAAGRVRAIRARLATLEVQWLTLLADERIPARKHRLDAVRAARRDLEAELDGLGGATGGGRDAAAAAGRPGRT